MRQAYLAASADGTLTSNPRQIMYCARPEILKIAGKDTLDSQYFCQTLLPDYIRRTSGAKRQLGHLLGRSRPLHRAAHGEGFGVGTLNVRHYVDSYASPDFEEPGFAAAEIETSGPDYCGLLYLEKEGFGPILNRRS